MDALKFSIIILLTVVAFSCQKEELTPIDQTGFSLETGGIADPTSSFSKPALASPIYSTPIFATPTFAYSQTELIVFYDPSTTDAYKNALRNNMGVASYETCAYCDDTIEKWIFDFSQGGSIEHKYSTAKEDEAEAEGMYKVYREFSFTSDSNIPMLTGGTGNVDFSSKVVGANSGVTIAILDTGVDANYPTFSTPFLYKNVDEAEIESGWDYVNDDDNCYDDNEYVHGTAVASIINTYLNDHSIPHQILPVKVANDLGKISLYKACCGMSYAAGTEGVDIVQMSFGWYDPEGDSDASINGIFSKVIEKYSDVLFVCSAGNSNADNDGAIAHYPSNYSQSNIISVAAANAAIDAVADFSNYGGSSVDFISIGTNLGFSSLSDGDGDGVYDMVSISGTSFSAPQIAAIAAKKLYISGMELTPVGIIDALIITEGIGLYPIKPTKYNKILLP